MPLKQRSTERRPISLDIFITHKLEYSARWKTRDLSLHGALIDMAHDDLPPECDVEAILAVKSQHGVEHHRIPARIIRAGENGVALRFRGYGNQTYAALSHLLYFDRTRPASA
ncbi:MAG: PilZ domain-containing protein [Acidiferrobacterales bacterium]